MPLLQIATLYHIPSGSMKGAGNIYTGEEVSVTIH